MTSDFAILGNGRAMEMDAIPDKTFEDFGNAVVNGVEGGLRISALFGVPTSRPDVVALYAVLADDARNRLCVTKTCIEGNSYESLTPRCPQAHLFEREIAEQFGLHPARHPWLKPVRFHKSWRTGHESWLESDKIVAGVMDYYRVEGDEIHEVAVGPVHAGIIEPGHFRFQCHGEHVFHAEISLGYQHRGVERMLIGGPDKRTIHYMETVAGDTSVGHAIAHCQVVEALSDTKKTARAQSIRGIALELERLANHVGDLGALSGDVGYLPTASYCGRIRGDFLNMTALICGNRFGRGLIRPGGVGFDMDNSMANELLARLKTAEIDTKVAIELLWNTPSAMARFEDIGILPPAACRELGVVGPAARASGIRRDARHDQPSGVFRFTQIPVSSWHTGDVFARAYVRWLEIQRSIIFIREQLQALPDSQVRALSGKLAPNRLAVSLIEGWRGEICHVALTDSQGRFARYKIVDPSFHNWACLAYALRSQQISDFPLCNKSFNLSYCGHDL